MKQLLGFACVLFGSAAFAFAGFSPVPEIDVSSGAAALALLSGGLLILRARRAKK